MTTSVDQRDLQNLLGSLNERAKELNCLYRVNEILGNPETSLESVIEQLLHAIPQGWQFPDTCWVRLEIDDHVFVSDNSPETLWSQQSPILRNGEACGAIAVFYRSWKGAGIPFFPEEQRLLDTIAERLGGFLHLQSLHTRLRDRGETENPQQNWQVIVDLLRKTDPDLYRSIARKMLNYLSANGIAEARDLLSGQGQHSGRRLPEAGDENRPARRDHQRTIRRQPRASFEIAAAHLSDTQILQLIQNWMQADRIGFLVQALENMSNSLNVVQNALTRFHHLGIDERELPQSTRDNIVVLLLLRFFTEQLEFVHIAKRHVGIRDFCELVQNVVFPPNSYGKLGGKSAGIFLSYNMLKRAQGRDPLLEHIRMPKTHYVLSDALHHFLNFNELNELIEQKYKTVEQIREEYPNIVQVFKNSNFPPEIIRGLALAMDDFGDRPIIVRSSSLLEDRVGAAFSGKYKSLFLANQGNREDRLTALLDAVAEVYASTFGPDPVEYRKERGLLDFHEEMAVIVQEVVGSRVGDYFFPSFAGVAFSSNEFRWSPRIRREDGVVRLVPGLGTRAVDRVSDDFPILASPGQPNLRVNLTADEVLRYSPRYIDVINLRDNTFETVEVAWLLRRIGADYPRVEQVVSLYEDGQITRKPKFSLDFAVDKPVVTFDGLIGNTGFMKSIKRVLDLLRSQMNFPVDIEFACDDKDFYILQCRAQGQSAETRPAPIPKDLPEGEILFTAHRYIPNGQVTGITHAVYVDPEHYASLPGVKDLQAIGKIVGRLNKLLPKRKFILIGPGRWGSRGDIRLGVSVTYSDINNTAMLIEVARKKGNYTPELSFGTHFFQDLVESGIRYLPLYPDDDCRFNADFLVRSDNILPRLLPEYAGYESTVRVVDLAHSHSGKVLRIRMNADLGEAMAHFETPGGHPDNEPVDGTPDPNSPETHWVWRLRMAEQVTRSMDPRRFGVKAAYVIGSSKNANAGPGSDIDLLLHFRGSEPQRQELTAWLEGWSLCLAEMNYLRTGYRLREMLDVHLVTDEDIKAHTSFAIKIGAVTDPARPLPMGKKK
jgi:pyruvate, water dikinase